MSVLEQNPGPPREHCALVTTEPLLQPSVEKCVCEGDCYSAVWTVQSKISCLLHENKFA